MGLSSTRIGEPTRRDRLPLVSAFAMALLTLHPHRRRTVRLPPRGEIVAQVQGGATFAPVEVGIP